MRMVVFFYDGNDLSAMLVEALGPYGLEAKLSVHTDWSGDHSINGIVPVADEVNEIWVTCDQWGVPIVQYDEPNEEDKDNFVRVPLITIPELEG